MGRAVIQRIPAELRRIFLLRGESEIASTGLVLAAILLLFMGACTWWSVRTQRASLAEERHREIQAAAEYLAETAGTFLAADELTIYRRLLMDAARRHEIAVGQLVLADGGVLAHTETSRISLPTIPQQWPVGPIEAAAPEPGPQGIALSYPVLVPGLGSARLDIVGRTAPSGSILSEAVAGMGVIGAAALLALLVVYRKMRRRVQAQGAIRESLLSFEAGETAAEALAVPEDLGPEAEAWNRMLREKKQLETQLLSRRVGEVLTTRREGSRDLDSACDVMRQGLLLVDRGGRITYANGAAAVFLRRSRDELVEAELASVLTEPLVLDTVKAICEGSVRTWTAVEVDHGPADAVGVLRFSMRPLRREDSNAMIVVIDDITQQRVADESRNAFVTQVTHELRAPLTNICLYAEMAIEQGSGNLEVIEKSLNVINQEAKRLERVVGDMLSISEMEAGKYELAVNDVRLDALFEDLRQKYGETARDKQIVLEFDLPPKLPVIQGDKDKITLALHNVLGNALKYTPNGGRVDVQVQVDDGQLSVQVSDTGIGVSPHEHERIFERFYRADDDRLTEVTGSGLGLALARDVIRMHGGDVTIDSELNAGSTFTITVPTTIKVA